VPDEPVVFIVGYVFGDVQHLHYICMYQTCALQHISGFGPLFGLCTSGNNACKLLCLGLFIVVYCCLDVVFGCVLRWFVIVLDW